MVSIITCTNRNAQMVNVFQNYSHQDWEQKELIVILNRDDMKLSQWKKKAKQYSNVTVYQLPEQCSLGECLNFAADKAQNDIIAKFDDDEFYSPYYISQAMHVFKNKQSDIVGKKKIFTYFQQSHILCIRRSKLPVAGPTIMFRKKVFEQVQFPERNTKEDVLFLRKAKKQFKIRTTNPYNFANIRRNEEDHTWQLSNQRIMKKCLSLEETDYYVPRVTQRPGDNKGVE